MFHSRQVKDFAFGKNKKSFQRRGESPLITFSLKRKKYYINY